MLRVEEKPILDNEKLTEETQKTVKNINEILVKIRFLGPTKKKEMRPKIIEGLYTLKNKIVKLKYFLYKAELWEDIKALNDRKKEIDKIIREL